MILDTSVPLPSHILAAIPAGFEGTFYQIWPTTGSVVIGVAMGTYDHIEIVERQRGVSIEDMEAYAIEQAVMGFRVGFVQHKLSFEMFVSEDELIEALAAATTHGDLDIADLLEAATKRGIGPVDPAPAVQVGGYRH